MALFLPQRWRRQPQYPTAIDYSNPIAQKQWAAVVVFGIQEFGSANPKGALGVNTAFATGPGGRAVIQSGRAVQTTGYSYGANAGMQLSTSSGIIVAKVLNADVNNLFCTRAEAAELTAGFYIDFYLNKARLVKAEIVVIQESSNTVATGELGTIAWSYNNSTGRTRIAFNGVLTTATSAQSFTHGTVSSGGYSVVGNVFPSEQYLLALSPDEEFSDAKLIEASINPWQLFAPLPTRRYFGAAAVDDLMGQCCL